VGKGRKGTKIQLSERFEHAIDRCAMKIDAKDTDSYLAEWRKGLRKVLDGTQEEIAKTEANRLEEIYDNNTLKELIKNDGWKNG
jgi:hypothetical protein